MSKEYIMGQYKRSQKKFQPIQKTMLRHLYGSKIEGQMAKAFILKHILKHYE